MIVRLLFESSTPIEVSEFTKNGRKCMEMYRMQQKKDKVLL